MKSHWQWFTKTIIQDEHPAGKLPIDLKIIKLNFKDFEANVIASLQDACKDIEVSK